MRQRRSIRIWLRAIGALVLLVTAGCSPLTADPFPAADQPMNAPESAPIDVEQRAAS